MAYSNMIIGPGMDRKTKKVNYYEVPESVLKKFAAVDWKDIEKVLKANGIDDPAIQHCKNRFEFLKKTGKLTKITDSI